jgi:hypothetical protein
MSTLLYTLGHRIARHRWKLLVAWCLLASATFAVAGLAGGQLVNDYTIPGTESQRGIDTLAQRFPQASGTTGQVVFTSSSGPIIDQQAAVNQQIQAISKVQHVSSVDDPFASDAVGTISPDKLNAMSSIQFDVPATSLPPEAMTQVEAAAQPPPGAAFTVTLGGAMYPPTGVGIGITELSLNQVLPLPPIRRRRQPLPSRRWRRRRKSLPRPHRVDGVRSPSPSPSRRDAARSSPASRGLPRGCRRCYSPRRAPSDFRNQA